MPLTDVRIRQARPTERPYRLTDGGGLFLEVRPNGSKFWRYAYRIGGKQNLFAVGRYPEQSLQDARAGHAQARALVREGRHPAHARLQRLAAAVAAGDDTFQAVAEAWLGAMENTLSAGYVEQIRRHLRADLNPKIGRLPVRSITPADLLPILESVQKRGAVAAIVTRRIASHVFTYAITKLKTDYDPTYPLRKSIRKQPTKHADAKGEGDLRALYVGLRSYGGNITTRIAVELLLLLFVRTTELRAAPWSEFDLDGGEWLIPAERMKKRRKHLVPLSPRAVDLLRELSAITGGGKLLFPNNRDLRRPMSRMTINRAIECMGFAKGEFTGHDFRATASTRLHEMGYREQFVEMQLAHAKTDKVAAAYNHAEYLPERKAMMAAWADWLAGVEATAPIAERRLRGRRKPMRRAKNPAQ